jgi:hypothetical protein
VAKGSAPFPEVEHGVAGVAKAATRQLFCSRCDELLHEGLGFVRNPALGGAEAVEVEGLHNARAPLVFGKDDPDGNVLEDRLAELLQFCVADGPHGHVL